MDRPLETQKRLLGNTALLSSAEAVTQLANFAFVVCLARVFGSELLGIYAFGLAIAALLKVVAGLGTHSYIVRTLSREPERTAEMKGALLAYQAVVNVALLGAAYLAARGLGASPLTVWGITAISAYGLVAQLTDLLILGYTARQEMGPAAALPMARRVLALALAGAAMLGGAGAELVLTAMPAAALLVFAPALLLSLRRFGRPRLRFERPEIAGILRGGLPFFGVFALTVLYGRLGIVYLTALAGEAQTGVFASAEKLAAAGGVAQLMFSAALFPVVARLWHGQRERFAELVQRAGRLVLFLSLPIATLLSLFAADIVALVYGEAFAEASLVLAAVAWVLVIRGVAQITTITGQATDHQRLLMASKAVGIAMLTLTGFALIPRYGAMGLVAALLVSELVATSFGYAGLRRAGLPVMSLASGSRVALACLAAAAVALAGAGLATPLRLIAVLGAGAAALWLFGAVRGNDLAYLRAILAAPPAR